MRGRSIRAIVPITFDESSHSKERLKSGWFYYFSLASPDLVTRAFYSALPYEA